MKSFLTVALIIVAGLAMRWGVTVGIIYLITLCFGLPFSLPVATGIWLALFSLKEIFKTWKGD